MLYLVLNPWHYFTFCEMLKYTEFIESPGVSYKAEGYVKLGHVKLKVSIMTMVIIATNPQEKKN